MDTAGFRKKTMPNFRKALDDNAILIFDGGMGTQLQARGMPPGISPEAFGASQPEVVREIHSAYLQAGARVITTNTFGGSGFKLEPGTDVTGFNRLMASLARKAAGDSAWVAGSVGPSGLLLRPLGDISFEELVRGFREQITGLAEGGADLILAETHLDLAEARAVVVAAREVCSLPVGVNLTFDNGVTLTGTTPEVFAETMRNMDVELVGINCGAGPEQFLEIVKTVHACSSAPVLAEPNAGLPVLEEGRTVFKLGPDDFAEQTARLVEAGASCLGGCCGTTPDHIQALTSAVSGLTTPSPAPQPKGQIVLTSRTSLVRLGGEMPVRIIGERVNPTGKKQLTAELQAGKLTLAHDFALEQVEQGARILDVNVGAPMVDETTLLPELVLSLSSRVRTPLCLDTADPVALEKTLPVYPASPLVNSISGEPGRLEKLGPLCAKYGAPFILLPLEGGSLPVTAAARIRIIEGLLARMEELGIPRSLAIVDTLVLTVSSKADAALHCLETIRYCRDTFGLPTVAGLSNISFGLPARELINSTFLSMASAVGLSACIANPGSARLREALASSQVLLGRDPQAQSFIAGFANWKPSGTDPVAGGTAKAPSVAIAETLEQAVLQGDKDRIPPLVDEALAKGESPAEIVDKRLIPAITEVGERYGRKEYFLPQLILSAETMQLAFDQLKPLLEKSADERKKPVVVMATVEGDIHDIGKNIVCLMLRNHGFEVMDLGKDVPASRIVEEAANKGAFLIGLSALMTTTMVKMEETVQLLREKALNIRVVVGGAVVTQAFADTIGADSYAADAVDAVKTAQALLDRS
jgi:5-methyltetrahydrofolate--homocysteine methyltransferase